MKVRVLKAPEDATRRAERVAKKPSEPPEPASGDSSPIDEQIASLLEDVSSQDEAQAAIMDASVQPDPPAASGGKPAIARPEARRRRRPRRTPARTARTHRPTETVKQALSDIAIELPRPYLPRPYLSYTVKQAFFVLAIMLLSIGVGILIVYLVPG